MIGIVFEFPSSLVPLFVALKDRKIPFREIDLSSFSFSVDIPNTPILPLYVNSIYASSYQRNNQRAIALAYSYLKFLAANGAKILNYKNAHLEVNKVDQLLAFRQFGLKIPRTWVFNDREQLIHLPGDFPFPLLIKPAQGGAGSLIQRFDSRDALLVDLNYIPTPPDELMLVQEYIEPFNGSINRVEVLNSKILYALHVYPTEDFFNMCPADAYDVEVPYTREAMFALNDNIDPDVTDRILDLFTSMDIDFGSIEYLTGEDGVNYFFDLNLRPSYRTIISGADNFDPWGMFADYLGEKLSALSDHSFYSSGEKTRTEETTDAERQGKLSAVVEINLPQDEIDMGALKNLEAAIVEFMEACNLEHPDVVRTIQGSFFRTLKFWFKKTITQDEVDYIYEQGKEALRKTYLDKSGAETADKLAEAADKLIRRLESFDSGVLRLGEILVVKITREGQCHLIVETLSPELARELADNPMLLRNPEDVFKFFESREKPSALPHDRHIGKESPQLGEAPLSNLATVPFTPART